MFRAYDIGENKELGEAFIEKVFPFLCTGNHVISLVGAGGKTTLMYQLAEEYSRRGCRTLVTTTTHIMKPEPALWAKTRQEIEALWSEKRPAVLGSETSMGKLSQPERLNEYMQMADITLIEADGAKRMACKVPNEREPVIPEETDIVIGVMGLDVLGKPLEEVCFRVKEAERLLQDSMEHCLTEEDVVKILTSEVGTKKGVLGRDYYIVLNKCDTDRERRQGKRILELLKQKGEQHVMLTCFKEVERK